MEPIGYYWWVWSGGQWSVEWTKSPYYAIRDKYLPAIKRTMKQIMVKGIGGELQWININPRDLESI